MSIIKFTSNYSFSIYMGDSNSLLIYIGEKGALYKEIELSTIQISKDTSVSQQTVSRKLIELEKEGLLKRIASTRGIKLRITNKGIEILKKVYIKLSNIFGEKKDSLGGFVESGLGEGSYYLSFRGYNEQFRKKMGIIPFKGTLNVKIDYDEFLQFIANKEKVIIDGFRAENRTFGSIIAYKIKLNSIDSAIIIPERTSHEKSTIEVISETNFRKKFNLKDGDKVSITA